MLKRLDCKSNSTEILQLTSRACLKMTGRKGVWAQIIKNIFNNSGAIVYGYLGQFGCYIMPMNIISKSKQNRKINVRIRQNN